MKTFTVIDNIKSYLSHQSNPQFFTGPIIKEGVMDAQMQAYCRETFGGSYFNKDTTMVGYYNPPQVSIYSYSNHKGMDMDAAVAFWREVEKRLGLKPTEIYIGSLPNTLVMDVDKFWKINHTRRGFYTMLLRCACSFARGKDFDADLEAYAYTSRSGVGNAVRYFLQGHTTPTYDDDSHHTYNRFRLWTDRQLKENLVKMIEV